MRVNKTLPKLPTQHSHLVSWVRLLQPPEPRVVISIVLDNHKPLWQLLLISFDLPSLLLSLLSPSSPCPILQTAALPGLPLFQSTLSSSPNPFLLIIPSACSKLPMWGLFPLQGTALPQEASSLSSHYVIDTFVLFTILLPELLPYVNVLATKHFPLLREARRRQKVCSLDFGWTGLGIDPGFRRGTDICPNS